MAVIPQKVLYNQSRGYFDEFIKATTQKLMFFEFLKTKFDSLEIDPCWNLRIGDLGTGNGASLIPSLEEIIHSHAPWDRSIETIDDMPLRKGYTEIFVDESNLGVLLDFIVNYCIDGYRFMSVHLMNNRYDFHDYGAMEGFFDVLTASHYFYYKDDWPKTLNELLHKLRPDGRMIIEHTSKEGFLYNLRKEFWPKLGVNELGETRPHSAEELIEVLNNVITQYTGPNVTVSVDTVESETLLNKDNFNEVLSFMLRTDFEKIEPAIQKEIIQYISENSIFKDSNFVLPFRDKGIIVKKHGHELVSYGRPWLGSDIVDINLKHLSSFLYRFLENELMPDLMNEEVDRNEKFLKNRGYDEKTILKLKHYDHQGNDDYFKFAKERYLSKEDQKAYDEFVQAKGFGTFRRQLYYEFIMLDLFMSHPYHANYISANIDNKSNIITPILKTMAFRDEFDSIDSKKDFELGVMTWLEDGFRLHYGYYPKKNSQVNMDFDKKVDTFVKAFEGYFYLFKHFDYQLKRLRDEYAIKICKQVNRPEMSYNDVLNDLRGVYVKLSHDKIIIPPNQNSLVRNSYFNNIKTDNWKEKEIIRCFSPSTKFFK